MAYVGPVTTAGRIALQNLQARIGGQVSRAGRAPLAVDELSDLIELVALRGHVLGSIADAEHAASMADELVREAPSAHSYAARARMRAVFHRFTAAITDLDTAASL